MKQLLQIGAEANIYRQGNLILKERVKKQYRHEKIDMLIRKKTTRFESRLLEKASKIIPVPKIINVDEKNMLISMEYIDGEKLRDCFDFVDKKEVCIKIGTQVAKLHDNNIIHGDLTTSNMIVKEGNIFFIDFGLGYISTRIEDKAVDLHLLKRALDSKHYKDAEKCFNLVLKGYQKSKDYNLIMDRFEKVEKRGRYKRKKK